MASIKIKLLTTAAALAGLAAAPLAAHATPYAYATNNITNLQFSGTANTTLGSATTNITDAAVYDSAAGSTYQGGAALGQAVDITQATSGPGPFPGENTFGQAMTNSTGTRADASIGAQTASGVTVQNVAEGRGNALGNSSANNNATITFNVTGTGTALTLNFTDAVNLIASTAANPQETATATITNTFSVSQQGVQTPIYTNTPSNINQQVQSQQGSTANSTYSGTFTESLTTPVLTNGVTYTISLTSSAIEKLNPGAAVPEPASLALLGSGLFGLGMLRRRRRG